MKFRDIQKSEKGMSKGAMVLVLIIIILVGIILYYGVQTISRFLGASNEKEAQVYEQLQKQNPSGGSSSQGGTTNKKDKNKKNEDIKNVIGKYVEYTPDNGSYSEITNNNTYSGTIYNTQDFKTEKLNWRIWSMDSKKLVLIADKPITSGGSKEGTLLLDHAEGYNNCVKILNDICKNCYSNNSLGANARSINIEDIENVLNKDVWKPEDHFYKKDGKEYHTYSGTKIFTTNKSYPYIYQYEEYSNIDGSKVEKGQGITRSKQDKLYPSDVYRTYEATSSLETTETYWNYTFSDKNFIDSSYYSLLYKDAKKVNDLAEYWLASRCVEGAGEYAIFGVQYTGKSKVDAYILDTSKGNMAFELAEGYKVRPMVEIDLSNIKLDTKAGTGDSADKAYKLEAK